MVKSLVTVLLQMFSWCR